MIYPPLSWSTSLLFSQGQGKEGVALAGSLISFTDSFLPAKGPGRLPRLAWHGFVPVALDHRSDPPFKVILKGELHPRDPRTQARRELCRPDTAAQGAGCVLHPGFLLHPHNPVILADHVSAPRPPPPGSPARYTALLSLPAWPLLRHPTAPPGGRGDCPRRCRWPGLTPAEGRRTCSEPGPGRCACLLPQRARCLGRTRHPEQAGPDRQLGTEPSRARLAQV